MGGVERGTIMLDEYRVWGPPGVGKTTWIKAQVDKLVKEHGSKSVLLVSFTKAAAEELASREMPIDRSQIGTLHAICYRALGRPEIAETKIDEWNSKVSTQLRLKGESKGSLDEPSFEMNDGGSVGQKMFQNIQLNRVRMIPPKLWPVREQTFYKRWCDWKDENGYIDFTDMLELGLQKFNAAPGNPRFIINDESQDSDKLSLTLLRRWAENAERLFLVGDPNQCIYSWKGSTPEDFLEPPISNDHQKVLKHSHRVPRGVHEYSQKWIGRLKIGGPQEYYPRDFDGAVIHKPNIIYKDPRAIMPLLDECIILNKTVMVLASCAYMLNPIMSLLRKQGYPFHNPNRKTRGDWNAWAPYTQGVSTHERFTAYMLTAHEFGVAWTWGDVRKFVPMLNSSKVLMRGAKSYMKNDRHDEERITQEELRNIFVPDQFEAALARDPFWLRDNVLTRYRNSIDYLARGYRMFGPSAFNTSPLIKIGTIHSVKGDEADRVIVFPDLSMAGMREWISNGRGHEEIIRLFYVAMTRAREDLVICGPSSNLHVRLP